MLRHVVSSSGSALRSCSCISRLARRPLSTSRPPTTGQPEIETFAGRASAPRAESARLSHIEPPRGMPPPGTPQRWARGTATGPVSSASAATSGGGGGGSASSAKSFAGPSRPRMVYERAEPRDLPVLKNKAPLYIVVAVLGLSAAGLFVLNAMNSERLASSVMRQVQFQLRNSKEVAAALGDGVRLADNWWGFGQSWTSGHINMMQGSVDLQFRIQGSKAAGTVYFTSIRPQQEGAWRIVRFKVNTDDGQTIRLEDKV